MMRLLFIVFLLSCNSNYTVGKKKGYFKIDFPEKEYKLFDQPGYPYVFEYPVYGIVSKDTSFFDDKAGDWWINIDVPEFRSRIYISYKQIDEKNKLDSLVNDAFKMAYKKPASTFSKQSFHRSCYVPLQRPHACSQVITHAG